MTDLYSQTIHGPASANFDEAKYPLIMTDWGESTLGFHYRRPVHSMPFGECAVVNEITDIHALGHSCSSLAIYPSSAGGGLLQPSIVLNGAGDVTTFGFKNTSLIPPKYQINFAGPQNGVPRRYLLRLINTAFKTGFTFSIDNHTLQVISSDFVSIVPYQTYAVNVAIGQRHNVIVEADQWQNSETNFWIRTWSIHCADRIGNGKPNLYEKTGIVRYDSSNMSDPATTAWPDAAAKAAGCSDETAFAAPIVPWCIDAPVNGEGEAEGEVFKINATTGVDFNQNYVLREFALYRIQPRPMSPHYDFQIDYNNPTLLSLANTKWDPQKVVISENYTDQDWVSIFPKAFESELRQHERRV